MTTVYFGNNGNIELAAITTMGISVKGSDSAIGFFGTGLKYALAVLLREKADVIIHSSDFTAKVIGDTITVRGKEFTTVNLEVTRGDTISKIELGITTHLGANWTLSEAFRELYSNTLDEKGSAWSYFEGKSQSYDTVISVSLEEFHDVYKAKDDIFPDFSSKQLVYQNDKVQVFKHFSDNLYYKGVKVYTTGGSHFTYNYLKGQDLTEDRTLSSLWSAEYVASNLLAASLSYQEAVSMFTSRAEFEAGFDMTSKGDVSKGFLDAVKYGLKHLGLPSAYEELLNKHNSIDLLYIDVTNELSSLERATLQSAVAFLNMSLAKNIGDFPIKVMDSLGQDTVGKAQNGVIYLARDYIIRGVNYTASTIYEEYVHLFKGLTDNTYEMQTYLFDTIIYQECERQHLLTLKEEK